MKAVLARLADCKRILLYALVQGRSASAAAALHDHRSLGRIITGTGSGFTDPTRLTRWTRGFLYAHLAIVVARLCIRAIDPSGTGNAPELSSVPGAISLTLRMVVLYGTILLVPAWTLRASHNARQLGASGMRFAPEWAAGWYFVPPGLFWKPYQVMKEIWQASVCPSDWRRQRGSPLVGWWWALWVTASWGGLLASGVALLALEPGDREAVGGAIGLARGLLHIPLTLALLAIILKVREMQMAHFQTQRDQSSDHE